MVEISPFRGVLFARARVEPGEVIAPPYDVIGPDEHRELLARSPHNIVRITLGDVPGERPDDYDERARLLRRWMAEGTLRRDAGPGYYVYRIRYAVPGAGEEACEFRALIGRVRVTGAIRPHENTFPKIVDDRFRLLRATRVNLGQILLLFQGADPRFDGVLREACGGEPILRVLWRGREEHALFRLGDGDRARRIEAAIGPATLTIADGHHRFETAKRYAREVEASGAPPAMREAASWCMVSITDLGRGGVSILPTHRLLRLRDRAQVAAERERFLRIFPPVDRGASGPPREGEIILHSAQDPQARRVAIPERLRAGAAGVEATPVAILHGHFIEGSGASVAYPRDREEGIRAVERGEADFFLELPPISIETFNQVLERGSLLPHKTTYFYPKLFSGLVLRDLED